jgi:4'-phosphopantetheinyl transferase
VAPFYKDDTELKKSAFKTVYAVLLPVPADKRGLTGREKVAYLSEHAREALTLSAHETGIVLGALEKDEQGAPLPSNGYYWSLAHKSDYVAAVAADVPIGIDIEKVRAVTPGLYRKIATKEEWQLGREDREDLFFRYWTAKESVLKVAGTGIRELAFCRITRVVDEQTIRIDFKGKPFQVQHFFHDGHVIAVVDVGCPIELKIMEGRY